MLEVLHRSQTARVCELKIKESVLRTPSILSYLGENQIDEEGTLTVEGMTRTINLFGMKLSTDSFIAPPKSSREQGIIIDYPGLDEAASIRIPLPEDIRCLKDKEFLVLENAFELRNDPRRTVEVFSRLRKELGFSPIIYASGIAEPSNMALLSYLGVDIFDDVIGVLKAKTGSILTSSGEIAPPSQIAQDIKVSEYNKQEYARELLLIREFIVKGRLRELVDMRAPTNPWAVAVLRLYDDQSYDLAEERCPIVGSKMACNTTQSLNRPEIKRFRNKIMTEYRPPEHKRVLVLLPCSAKKPYSLSKTHKMFTSAIRTADHDTLVHEVIITSPLGVVPRELETFYPANAYDIPVTGEWKAEEKAFIRDMLARLLENGYEKVICHLGDGYEFLQDLADMTNTVIGGTTSPASLQLLDSTLREVTTEMPRAAYQTDRMNTMASILRFQFGIAAEHIIPDAHVTGKYPYWKLFSGTDQLGMLTPERGMVSLTLEGGELLMKSGSKIVEIQDFILKGNLFAVGVIDADPAIRIGDEVVVCFDGNLRGVGVAMMPGTDMKEQKRGIAVKIRHKSK